MNYFDFVNAFARTFVIVIIDYIQTEKWDTTIRKRNWNFPNLTRRFQIVEKIGNTNSLMICVVNMTISS